MKRESRFSYTHSYTLQCKDCHWSTPVHGYNPEQVAIASEYLDTHHECRLHTHSPRIRTIADPLVAAKTLAERVLGFVN